MELLPEHHDDPEFLSIAGRCLQGAAATYQPQSIFVVHLDNWFGQRWLRFSGKLMGAVGVRTHRLTVPPFHPHRIRSEQQFQRNELATDYGQRENGQALHRFQRSEANLNNYASLVSRSGMFLWYSGRTLYNGAGSLMLYSIQGGEDEAWYVSFKKQSRWYAANHVGISPERFTRMTNGSRDLCRATGEREDELL